MDELISKETDTRDTIVNFINKLNDSIIKNPNLNNDFPLLLSKAQDIFEKINENIKMVHELKVYSNQVSDKITDLLIKVEANPNNKESYIGQIQELKNIINDFSTNNEEMKSKLLLNDIKINAFLQEGIVKKYLSDFNVEVEISTPNKLVEQTSINTVDEDIEENNTLLISEKSNRVVLPYSKKEILLYLEQYPDEYRSAKDVINKEFIFPLDYYIKHPVVARFRESYSLIRDRESKSIIDAFKFAVDIMFNYDLNPAIIAACKTQDQLENYLSCLERKKLDEFTDFEIKFEISPLSISF